MSALWTAAEATAATGGRGAGAWRATGVSIDSRTLDAGDLFVALTDVRDGHDFVADAIAKGAAAALVARPMPNVDPVRLLIVDDTQRSLEALGAAARARTSARVIGITGSVGKTGARAALARGLARQGQTYASAKSYNNHWGVPLSLAQMPASCDFAVFEMGMNRAGEIRRLTGQVRPEGALITAIAPAHLEFFDDVTGIAHAKAEIFEGVEPGGFAVVPADSEYSSILLDAARAAGIERIVTFGRDGDVQATRVAPDPQGTTVEAAVHGAALRYRVGIPGAHWVQNSLALIAVVDALGADIGDFALSLAELAPEPGRGCVHDVAVHGGRASLIDDSYNANPASMRAALEVLGLAPGRKVAALGAMKELGPDARALHAALAEPVLAADVALVFTAGEEMKALAEALPAARLGAHEADATALVPHLKQALAAGDTLLVKGSLASGMSGIVRAFLETAD